MVNKDPNTRQFATIRRDLNTVMSGVSEYAGDISDLQTSISSLQTSIAACTQSSPTRAIDGTVYTNGTKIRVVVVTGLSTGSNGGLVAYCDTNANPTTIVSQWAGTTGLAGQVVFVVTPSYKYKVTSASALKLNWFEWDLH